MSRFLIVYASHHGQTRKIATRIAEHMRMRGHEADAIDLASTPDAKRPPLADYAAVVLGSRVEFGRHASAMTEFICRHREALARMPTAFFSVSMAASEPGAGADPKGYLASYFDAVAWRPTHAIAVAGGLPYRDYNAVTRFVLKLVSRAAGHPIDTRRNHELTDWAQVHELADGMITLAAVPAPSRAPRATA